MVLGNGIHIILLDIHIGDEDNCQALKQQFQNALQLVNLIPPDKLDVLICSFKETDTSISFVHTPGQVLQLIEEHYDKQIVFVSSGSIGQYMLPLIINMYQNVYRFYFFGSIINNYHLEFSLNYQSYLQTFNHEIDLLVQLIRDISNDIIVQGRIYLQLEDAQCAMKCFEYALQLNLNANQIDTFHNPYLKYIDELIGDENNIGLIQQAKNILK